MIHDFLQKIGSSTQDIKSSNKRIYNPTFRKRKKTPQSNENRQRTWILSQFQSTRLRNTKGKRLGLFNRRKDHQRGAPITALPKKKLHSRKRQHYFRRQNTITALLKCLMLELRFILNLNFVSTNDGSESRYTLSLIKPNTKC
jgi:hypothetical protein